VAWRNHPPTAGTPGTVANAVANLNRVRAEKQAARRTRRSGTHHEPNGDRLVAAPTGDSGADRVPGRTVAVAAPSVVTVRAPATPKRAASPRRRRDREDDIPVPASAAKVREWATTWVSMCERPDLAEVAIKEDDAARQHFDCSARQLRHVRYAVVTGALRRRATELAIALPDAFREPASPGTRLSG